MTKSTTKTTNRKKTAKNAQTTKKASAAASKTEDTGVTVEAAQTTPAEFISKNAIPLGMVAAGIGILAARNINGGDNAVTNAAARGRKKLAAAAETGRGKARKSASKLRGRAGNGLSKSKQTVAAHPVAAGVAAAAVGAGLAVAVPKLINRGRS
ncbi:hypothetical protein [Hwanghaeella sp.]|uniref:hypothetical protein n=1 Tax=Hwanghaeella sp. TaxID=2605943 RepID=UPI003CCBBE26